MQVVGHGKNGNRCKFHLCCAFRSVGTSTSVVWGPQFPWGMRGYIFCLGGPLVCWDLHSWVGIAVLRMRVASCLSLWRRSKAGALQEQPQPSGCQESSTIGAGALWCARSGRWHGSADLGVVTLWWPNARAAVLALVVALCRDTNCCVQALEAQVLCWRIRATLLWDPGWICASWKYHGQGNKTTQRCQELALQRIVLLLMVFH